MSDSLLAFFTQVTVYITRKREHQKQTSGYCVKFPVLRKRIANARLQQVGNAANNEIPHKQFYQARPGWLWNTGLERDDRHQAFVDKRQISGEQR